jgi:hypothetical protein
LFLSLSPFIISSVSLFIITLDALHL